jgi:hemoglobin-like flavoprotein
MTSEQKNLVQQTFGQVVPIQEQAAQLFYDRLFTLDPSLRRLFEGDMKRQGALLMTMIGTAVNGLDRLEEIAPAVHDLGCRHAGYGVRSQHYCLLSTIDGSHAARRNRSGLAASPVVPLRLR